LAAILITRQILGNIKEALLPYLQWQARLCKVGYELVSDLSPGTPPKGDDSFENECYKEALDGAELRHRTVSFEETSIPKRDDNPETNKKGYRRDSIYVKRSLSLTQAEVESEMKEVKQKAFHFSNNVFFSFHNEIAQKHQIYKRHCGENQTCIFMLLNFNHSTLEICMLHLHF
jgi:hypothetical protein